MIAENGKKNKKKFLTNNCACAIIKTQRKRETPQRKGDNNYD
jgi:hypothetical protein